MNLLVRHWQNHGTKILGTVTMIGAACNGGDHYLTQILTNGQHALISLGLMITGSFTIQRGFTNTKRASNDSKP